MNKMRTESWCGHDIRFVELNGEWCAILNDVCDALDIPGHYMDRQLDSNMMQRVRIDNNWVIAVNELAIYDILFNSNELYARKFKRWTGTVMQKLRSHVGLKGYEVMRMTEPDIQEDIDNILDTLFWDEENHKLMQSVTVQGGDVEQIPFE